MSTFPIFIPGTPRPQGSKSVNRHTGHMFEANPSLKAWRSTMAASLIAWTGTWFGAWEPYNGPLAVDATFWMPRPQRPTYSLPAVKPDVDKLCRALGDAMTESGLIKDDARITTWHARKRYAEPGREGITIHHIKEDSSDGA